MVYKTLNNIFVLIGIMSEIRPFQGLAHVLLFPLPGFVPMLQKGKYMKYLGSAAVALVLASGFATSAQAVVIDNGLTSDTVGYWSVDMASGGQVNTGTLTARGSGGDIHTTNVIYDYFTYISTGDGNAFQLPFGDTVTSTGAASVSSSGWFIGSNGNRINWTVDSSIADGSAVLTNRFNFSAEEGELGTIRLFQYLDEDVIGAGNDAFFTRGSVAGGTLELFTVDAEELFGVSHGGAYNSAGGLVSADFAGWATCIYNSQKPALENGTQSVSLSGQICSDLSTTSLPGIGTAYGPEDIVSVLAWDVTSSASGATIITTLGGLPDITQLPPGEVPEPAALGLFGMGLLGLAASRRRRASR